MNCKKCFSNWISLKILQIVILNIIKKGECYCYCLNTIDKLLINKMFFVIQTGLYKGEFVDGGYG